MKRLNIILVSTVLLIAGMNISYAQVGIRTDLGVVGYKTTCFDPLQVSSTPGFGFQLGGTSIVIGRTGSSIHYHQFPTCNQISPDPFIRYFLFPWFIL